MPGNQNTKSGILQRLFICRTSELNPRVTMNSDQKIYGHIEQLTDLLDRILIQKHQILNDEDKARIQKVYQLIDQSLLKELKECDFLKNIDVAELEK